MINQPAQFLSRHQGTILKLLLSLIVAIFVTILISAYLISKRANPVFLDENGKPVNTQSAERPARPY